MAACLVGIGEGKRSSGLLGLMHGKFIRRRITALPMGSPLVDRSNVISSIRSLSMSDQGCISNAEGIREYSREVSIQT